MNGPLGVPRLRGAGRLKAELQTRCPVGSWPQLTSKLWRCSLPMNRKVGQARRLPYKLSVGQGMSWKVDSTRTCVAPAFWSRSLTT